MATQQSPEDRELSLVGKVEMRIALADSDEKLSSTLKTYLAPLLLKLASEHQSVRKKVISICQHINTRVKPDSVQLPVAALLKQSKEQTSTLIRYFDILYVQQGVGRLSHAERVELLPVVVKDISRNIDQEAQHIFILLLRLLESFTLPLRGSKEDDELRSRFGVSEADTTFLSQWLGKLILFSPLKGTASQCPGLSADDCVFLQPEGTADIWNPATGGLNLLRTKTLAVKFLASGLFQDQERFFPALFASADTASTISGVGDDMVKRAFPAMNLEDDALVNTLFNLYFGTEEITRARPPLRLKILILLNKSTLSTSFADNIIQMVNDDITSSPKDGDDTVMSNGTSSNTSLGREATKLRSAVFTYINFVARYAPAGALQQIAPQVVSQLRDFVDNQGWPKPGVHEDLDSRGYAYEIIGLLVKSGPRNLLIEEEDIELGLLRWLFSSLAKDSSGNAIIVSIEESLSTILSAAARVKLTSPEQLALENLLYEEMEQSQDLERNKRLRSTRYVALRFANRCLPYDSVSARLFDLMGLGVTKDRAEVREEAKRGLSPYWHQMLNGSTGGLNQGELSFPRFEDTMKIFPGWSSGPRNVEPRVLAQQALEVLPNCFQEMTAFARRMLFQEAMQKANVAVSIDSEWERKVDVAVQTDVTVRETIKTYLQGSMPALGGTLAVLQSALFEVVISQTSSGGENLLEFLALGPDNLTQDLVPYTDELLPVLRTSNHSRRLAAAHAFGILGSHRIANSAKINTELKELHTTLQGWESAVGTVSNHVHGALTALAYYFSRAACRGEDVTKHDLYEPSLKSAFDILTASRDDLLKEASYILIGQLCMFGGLSLSSIEGHVKIRTIVDKLYDAAKGGNEPAILCIGQLAMALPEQSESEASDLQYVLDQLHKLHEVKQAEVHFSLGEAFSYLASGWNSGALATKMDIEAAKPTSLPRSATLGSLLERILKDCQNTKPSLKKAAVMWLLCLVQFCGDQPELQSRLPKCQVAFKRCLGDRDELVQETASRGLGLIYEKGDRSLKDDLVRDLVSSFSSDRQSQLAGNVSADTQLFEPGALPTGDGSVSTYKDIMSLASEVGDSSLVYRFMSMASSNAIWSSRAAFGRFGLSNVLSDSSVDGYLANNPKLYPKLFRYRFDPNSGVQRSMNDIWNALVKDSTATIDKHYDAIMSDLLISILGKEWRVRQASCAAIADLVSWKFERYEQYLEQIWTQCFKVLDDIKESVRAAAASLARTLTGVLTRALESDGSSSKTASAMLKHVLPFLLSPSGMESSAKEVQAFSVHTLLEIIKKSSATTLRAYIPELVERLIGLLSSLEPEAVNYIHLNATKYNLTEQKIDDMRLSSVRSSPLMEAIERCLDLLDDPTMRELQPRLENAMKSAVGLPSKVGSSRVLVTLSTRRMALFRPFTDDFLKLTEKLVLDRNETVSSSYAAAAGYLARGASDKQLLRLISFAKRLYFESEGDREAAVPRRAIASGEIMLAVAKQASDRFSSLASSALPFVFVAKHDPDEHVKEQFQNTWNETVGGSRMVVLYLGEILEICMAYLDSPQWTLKHTSARAVAAATIAACSMEATLSEKVGGQLWPAIEKALGGKTWEGKETVLFAFVKFVEKGQTVYSQRQDIKTAISKIAVREAKRQNAGYRQHSVKAFGQIALARVDLDMSETAFDIVSPLISDSTDGEDMEVDGDSSRKNDEITENTHAAAVETLFASINSSVTAPDHINTSLVQAIDLVASMHTRPTSVRRAFFESVTKLFDRIRQAGKGALIDFDVKTAKLLLFGPDEIEALRLARADAIQSIRKTSDALARKLNADIQALSETEKSAVVRDRLLASTE